MDDIVLVAVLCDIGESVALNEGEGIPRLRLNIYPSDLEFSVPVPHGQKQALLALWAKGYHMVIFLWGKDEPIKAEIYWPEGMHTKIWKGELTRQRLFEICENWARWADANPAPFQYREPAI